MDTPPRNSRTELSSTKLLMISPPTASLGGWKVLLSSGRGRSAIAVSSPRPTQQRCEIGSIVKSSIENHFGPLHRSCPLRLRHDTSIFRKAGFAWPVLCLGYFRFGRNGGRSSKPSHMLTGPPVYRCWSLRWRRECTHCWKHTSGARVYRCCSTRRLTSRGNRL